ncbi:MAG: C69 family dipeptidase [Erysipelotrichaceae bacterium]|nr:C69 family dipeptidase [Erysipelotrichaceae bacterium]
MGCTTILVGKKASYDGSTMIARNDDSSNGKFTAKKFQVIHPENMPRIYKSVLSKFEVELPENPLQYTAMPNAVEGDGMWAAAGVNIENIGMTATETITSNARVLGADPLVKDGFGEEDIVVITLPYIHSAKEGVKRLGLLLEQFGTYESNGIAFSDVDSIWYMETIGGHHWIARKVPDDSYVMMPNQFGIDEFDFEDAYSNENEYMCSKDLKEFIEENHLNLSQDDHFNPRYAFGSHSDSDHVYNSPRAWYMGRYFNPATYDWDNPHGKYSPESDELPWCLVPEKKITPSDVKYILSSHYQGTPYDPYGKSTESSLKGKYRTIGINRTDFVALIQLNGHKIKECQAIEWIAEGSNVFNTMVPLFAHMNTAPEYLANTTKDVSTDNFYWASRLIGALADASYGNSITEIDRYQLAVEAKGNAIVKKYEKLIEDAQDKDEAIQSANEEIVEMLKQETNKVLNKVLYIRSLGMKNAFNRSDN